MISFIAINVIMIFIRIAPKAKIHRNHLTERELNVYEMLEETFPICNNKTLPSAQMTAMQILLQMPTHTGLELSHVGTFSCGETNDGLCAANNAICRIQNISQSTRGGIHEWGHNL